MKHSLKYLRKNPVLQIWRDSKKSLLQPTAQSRVSYDSRQDKAHSFIQLDLNKPPSMKTVCPLQPTHSPASPSSLCRSFFHICSEPLFSLCLLSCSPATHHWRAWPFPLINFFVGIGRLLSGSPKPSLFHAEEVPFSQPLLISWLLQPQPSLLNLLKFKTD